MVSVINAVLDALIKGLGVDAAVTAATTQAPWLALPIVSSVFKYLVGLVAGQLDDLIKKNVDIIVVRVENDMAKVAYDEAIKPVIAGGPTDAELQAAKDAMDKLVHRAK